LFRLNIFRPLLREAARDYDDDESDHAVVYLGEPIRSGSRPPRQPDQQSMGR